MVQYWSTNGSILMMRQHQDGTALQHQVFKVKQQLIDKEISTITAVIVKGFITGVGLWWWW